MRNLLERKNPIKYNLVNILIKTGNIINISITDNYKKAHIKVY